MSVRLSMSHYAKTVLNKKSVAMHPTLISFNIDAQEFRKSSNAGNRIYQLTCASRSANHGQIGWHWLAGNSYFLRRRIFNFLFF